MGGRVKFTSAAIFFAVLLGVVDARGASDLSQDRIRADVAYLADDAREGRETGSDGYDAAAKYVIERMKELGVRPPRPAGWRQHIKLRSSVRDIERARFSVSSPKGAAIDLVHLEDYISA